ncbi:centrosome-associated protein 350 isoform X3 [Sphaeramia orbicularis]|uniref:centrosome-associated protein 350 isoform X3 n=1 Tax=Sphaeramia orbicularis TaxID=375764 RepID=UPI00117C371F|nr:centrosome-associated protein 350 isoform X3 [Sphaeramia orbicularis]
MRSSKRTEASLKSSTQHDPDICTELSTAWKSLAQSKVALRHIENHLEVGPGTGVFLDSLMDSTKKKSSRTVRCREGRQVDDSGGSTKQRRHSQQSPEKSSSRSPLRNSTQDNNVHRNNIVEFREPLASYREATPPPHPSSQQELYSLQSVPGYSPTPLNPLLSQLVYQRDTRDKQTDRDLDSTHSSALESTEVRYLNDQPVLDTLRTFKNQSHPGTETDSTCKAQFSQSMDSRALTPGSVHRGGSTPSTSPGSASQRLENLRRHQPDDKLEKLKERIRRQRQHLEETAEREKLLSYLEQPIIAAVQTSNMPTAKVRKVAAAPPAPIYKGFNTTETKIQTSDGKVWKEEEYHNLSREIYRDLSQQFADSSMSHQQKEQRVDVSKERRPPKPVRKVQRVGPASDLNAKPVISPASWRDGQKLVKMVLGPVPKSPREEKHLPSDTKSKTVVHHRSRSDQCSELDRQSRPNSQERPHRSKSHSTTTNAAQNKAAVGVSTGILSADIQGILSDLQLECKAPENEERARQRSRGGFSGRRGRWGSGSRTRAPVSAWGTTGATGSSSRGCRSASPFTHRPKTADTTELGQKKRHYDADTVRQYIAQQQEKRKRRQAEEKRALKEEAEQRNQRLQELYRKQRGTAKTVGPPTEPTVAPVQKRLQETYTKLLLEGVQLEEEATQTLPGPAPSQLRPMYQPSGESDKENKRLEPPQSPSSSDRSLNDQPPPPLSRNDLDYGVASLLQPDRLIPVVRPMTGTNDHLLSQLLRLETALAEGDAKHAQRPAMAPNRSRSKMSRIEALKATAASLSNRIESEARKLAGDGINYGAATTLDVDSLVATRSSHIGRNDSSWMQANSKETAVENNDMGFRIHKILTNAGHSSYNGIAPPGTGNQTFKGQKEKDRFHNSPQTVSANITGYTPNSHTPERRLTNGLETIERIDKLVQRSGYGAIDKDDKRDSSSGSISEGPLSEGSLSDGEPSPSHPTHNHVSIPVDHLEALEYCAAKRGHHQRLSEFHKEAESCSALTSLFAQQDASKTAWEELNKGSPLSVINIFTKNLHGYIKASEGNSERNSPSGHSLHSGNGPGDVAVYEDDFVSTHCSGASGQLKKGSNTPSVSRHFEELLRRSPYEKNSGGTHSHHSSFHSSVQSPCLSSGSTSGSSPRSKNSTRKRGTASDHSDATLVEEQRNSCSPPSEVLSSESRKKGSERSSTHSQAKSGQSNDTLGQVSGLSHQSLGLDAKKSPPGRLGQSSPGSPDLSSPDPSHSPSDPLRGSSLEGGQTGRTTETRTTGELQYSPAVLQQRMAAELHYLETIEESARQLGDLERLMGVSMAQQESASLAQMLKAKQQRHEHELYELKIKAEREALETKLQLEENKQRVARAHIELQESLAAAQKQTLDGLQEATTKMMSQQAEAARYTAETARHIKEMTEMTHSQVMGAVIVPPVATESSDQQEHSSHMKQRREKADSDSFPSEMSSRGSRPNEPLSSQNSLNHSDSVPFRRPELSGADSSSHHSPSNVSSHSEVKWRRGTSKERTEREEGSTSIEDEVPIAANDSLCSDSIPSVVDEKADSTSVATEYSFKFDESMTEDEIEERSFRSLLPSEAHRRGTLDKKSRHHDESEEDGTTQNSTLLSGSHNVLKPQDVNMAFSGGQDSFSQFTMDMVRQYMKDEEVRLQHQSALLHLRQKALKEKARTELAWLEHQKKRLRGKGEDDKMPPIRKKQRGLLMKLQQEQAEIKRLQEANKAARKERQLLLKQQEEIERMRSSTLRLKERLKCAGAEAPPETPVSMVSEAASSDMRHADTDVRSPSPSLSISGSETSSIMQKLKKMRTHMDEKHCSPVHYFFSVFTAHHWASLSVCLPNLHPKFQLFICNQLVRFLTKREQQLMQRRHHAEELLQWKQRLDREEAEVRRIEKEALAVWDRQTSRGKVHDFSETQKKEISDVSPSSSHQRRSEPRTDNYVSEGDISSVTPESSINTERPVTEHPESPSSLKPVSAHESSLTSIQSSAANYTQEFTSTSPSTSRKSVQSSPVKGSYSAAASPSDGSSKTKMQLGPTSRRPNQAHTEPSESLMGTQTEPLSDQSDIEGRIRALKEELRKRKFMACQLKKEQKKRHKERLKAQEASLLKQLETYNNFIEKTKAELNTEPSSTPDTKSPNRDAVSLAEQPSIKPPSHRFESSKISNPARTHIHPSLDNNSSALPDQSRSTSVPEQLPDEDPLPVTPVHGSPESLTSRLRNHQAPEGFLRSLSTEAHTQINKSGDENIVSDHRSALQEELEVDISNRSKDQHSEHLLKLQKKDTVDSQTRMSAFTHTSPSVSEEHHYPPSVHSEPDGQIEPRQTCEAEEALKSQIISLSKSLSAPVDLKMSPQSDRSHSTDSLAFSSKEMRIKDNETSSPLADGYHDDFESSVDSSPRGGHHTSKPASELSFPPIESKPLSKDKPSRPILYDSQNEEVEEEIPEELSHRSFASDTSHQSERLLDLHDQTQDSKHDTKNTVNSTYLPNVSSVNTSPSPLTDQMPDFNIGDRVLVSGVQPGTLRFKGPTSFANGFWAGVELDKSEGSNNGTYDGVLYFECDEHHGIFAPPDRITHLTDKFEMYTDTTEDDDSFFDDMSDEGRDTSRAEERKLQKQGHLSKGKQTSQRDCRSDSLKVTDESVHQVGTHINLHHYKESMHPVANGKSGDIILDFADADVTSDIRNDKGEKKYKNVLGTVADKLLHNFVNDTVRQFAEIKKAKEQKIDAANQMNGHLFGNDEEEWMASVEQKDGLPFFLTAEKEELSSPELCNRPESPVLGASGQEELAKRLAELELSRELLDELGDDQDWFDEDFGLSSRREQQKLKQKQREEEEQAKLGVGLGRSSSPGGAAIGGLVSPPGGEQQVKTPPRPEVPLPLPPKLPEQPAMVVPHSAVEVQKMVYAATQEIWESFSLETEGAVTLTQLPNPKPSQEYLGKEANSQDQEAICICSYRKAVYDLTWEILQEIYSEDPNTNQPQWVKPRRVKPSFYQRVKTPGDISKIQEFLSAEVLKLYGLTKDESQKSDWQKMLKFGRKKRDRVDHILVQELHEEEAQWVNYDEDELFVKMQLADSIFDALLKDTANVLTQIYDKQAQRDGVS